MQAYNAWKTGKRRKDVLKVFKAIYESSFFGNGDLRCDILREPQYSVLALHYTHDFDPEDFTYLMDHTQEVLLTGGYTNYMSDRKTITLDGGAKQNVERHYLKPAYNNPLTDEGLVDRKYGNVIIEVFYDDEMPQLLKLTCNYYSERTMQKEKGIDKLMEEVLR